MNVISKTEQWFYRLSIATLFSTLLATSIAQTYSGGNYSGGTPDPLTANELDTRLTNNDLTIKQLGTSKMLIRFFTGNGAGSNAERANISSDGITLANGAIQYSSAGASTLTSVGANDTLVNAPVGQAVRIRNNSVDVIKIDSTGINGINANPYSITASGSTLTIDPWNGGIGTLQLGNSGDAVNFPASASVSLGGGTSITKILSGTAALNFASIAAQSAANLSITVTGVTFTATPNTICFCGPNLSGFNSSISWSCGPSAADLVSVEVFNGTAAAIDPDGTGKNWRATCFVY